MIDMPDFSRAFAYENDFILSCDVTRIGKILAHYELYKRTIDLPGSFVECGVFKGASYSVFAMFRDLLEHSSSRRFIGFDTFSRFPETDFIHDKTFRQAFVDAAGDQSISKEQMLTVLHQKRIDNNIELIEGNITKTVPAYIKKHPELKISLLNLDTDVYEPAVTILEYLYPRIVGGGILILDDYGIAPGETKAVDDFFRGEKIRIRRFPFRAGPCYIVKDGV